MKLREYFKKTGIKIKSFAHNIGVTDNTLQNIMDQKHDIKLSIAIKIERETGGKVTCNDLVVERFIKEGYKKKKEEVLE